MLIYAFRTRKKIAAAAAGGQKNTNSTVFGGLTILHGRFTRRGEKCYNQHRWVPIKRRNNSPGPEGVRLSAALHPDRMGRMVYGHVQRPLARVRARGTAMSAG